MVQLQTKIKRLCALLQCSPTEVVSEGLDGDLCKPPWNEAGEEQQSEINIHRNNTLLIFC